MIRTTLSILTLAALVVLGGCDSVLGSKDDETTAEIFDAGRSEPGFISEAEYVPLFPFFSRGADGLPFEEPRDIYLGYDEFIYVVDARGLHVLDLAGRPATFVGIPGGGDSVVQDRRLHLYVTARRDTLLNGQTWSLPVVMHYSGLASGVPTLEKIIWHPFDDDSRRFNRPDPIATDEQVSFTGVGILWNNSIYVARQGPINDRTSVITPHNTIMEFTDEGVNVQSILALHPTRQSLRSAVNPTDVITFVQPPQRSFFPDEKHLMLAQSSALVDSEGGEALRYAVLSIRAVLTSDGIEYRPDTEPLNASANPDRGDGFLYGDFRFERPSDIALAADGSNYIFVTDMAKDSLFIFTGQGVEGVAPPPGARSSKPVIVSFGGTGDGARQFRNPDGVSYFNRIVYVADTGNNRISRFRLNTDFE